MRDMRDPYYFVLDTRNLTFIVETKLFIYTGLKSILGRDAWQGTITYMHTFIDLFIHSLKNTKDICCIISEPFTTLIGS